MAELQIFYLQKDASSWVKNSTEFLDAADKENKKIVEERRASDEKAATGTIVASFFSVIVALGVGIGIAFRTSRSITEPLSKLMTVAHKIGNTGDLDHNVVIDTERQDEIGELARTFANMVTYLKEMATVSEAIANGDLMVEVEPRSKQDTLGHAFQQMVESLRGLVRSVRDLASQVASASSQVAGASDESAKISLQGSSAIDEVTSTMHEMSVNVQNMVKSTQTQASSVSETSASIDQMVASIQRVADTAKVLLDISNRSREEVHSGITTMDKATEGLNKINNTIRVVGIDHRRARTARGRYRQDHRGYRRPGRADQPAGPERRHRSGARRRARAGIRGGGGRSPQAGRKVGAVDQGNFRTDSKHPEGSPQSGREHGREHDHRQRRPGAGRGAERGAAQDLERGHRGLQVRAGNRRSHQRAVARVFADRAGHDAAERNHARDQLGGGRAGLGRTSGGEGHGAHARADPADRRRDRPNWRLRRSRCRRCRASCWTRWSAWPAARAMSITGAATIAVPTRWRGAQPRELKR